MGKKITIKDLADKAGVSIGTVHCALAGKPGVGEETRSRIVSLAKTWNYSPNAAASSLKRKAIRLAAVFPGPTDVNRFYFSYVWNGIHEYLASMRDYNIDLVELPYYNDAAGQGRALAELLEEERLDGVLTLGYMDRECRTLLRRFKKKGVPVVLVGSDVQRSDRFCCVQPDYDVVGRTLAELLNWQAPQGPILVCAGSHIIPSHYEIVLGLEAFFRDSGLDRVVVKVNENGDEAAYYDDIARLLSSREPFAACCSVSARSSVLLARALEATKAAGTMPAVGCDVFDENIRSLELGTFTNLIHKNPYSQAYMATKCLAEYIFRNIKPARDTLLVGSEIVFQSGLPTFRSGQQTLHAVMG